MSNEKGREVQLESFASELKRKTRKKQDTLKNWRQAFEELRDYLETLPEDKKQVVFFDEMPWLDNQRDFYNCYRMQGYHSVDNDHYEWC